MTKFQQQIAELQARWAAGDVQGANAILAQFAAEHRLFGTAASIVVTTLTDTVRTANAAYTVPGKQTFLVHAVRGLAPQLTLPNSETTAFASGVFAPFSAATSPSRLEDRLQLKANYTRIDALKVNQGNEPPLLDIDSGKLTIGDLNPRWGAPWQLRVPRALVATTKVTLELSFLGSVAAVIGAATNYGVMLEGLAVLE